MGGLGNQLFQIFTTISYGIKSGRRFIFPYSEYLNVGITRPTYWKTFLKSIVIHTTNNSNTNITNNIIQEFPVFREMGFEYKEIPFVNIENISLFGYFQSYKHFENDLSTIYSMIHLREQKQYVSNGFFKESNDEMKYHNISMHFRLGDYKDKIDYHPIMPFEYYHNTLHKIISFRELDNINMNYIVYYFCEEEDVKHVSTIVNRLQEYFPKIEFIRVNNKYPDWHQMLLMSCCDDNIIANSTFSWWGAYFNEKSDKIVCYPSVWFGPRANTPIVNDLFPPTWHKIHF
jgi:hypothetical protein